jgi:DNA primase
MAGKIPDYFVQDLLARVDLVDLIDSRVPLKRSGSNYVARCPFHSEKTPSFSVSREKQFYYCFGCGAHGTAIGFLMEYDRLSFVEAVETLADAVGLTIPAEKSGRGENQYRDQSVERLYEVQEQVCRFYQGQLKAHATAGRAVEYLKGRGVSGELAHRYRLGYAPPGNRNLPGGLPQDALKAAGLIVSKDAGQAYDWFRDRIIFPIRDRRGRIVGFGGRVLGGGVPKYLNSPETAVFKKHREVYGLYELLDQVRKPEFIIVVEGYMDVIALAQFGIPNAVATLGTATSGDHVSLLFRYTNELVFCFDGDAAGRNAAWKALEASLPALREGRQIRFLELPEKHDPDSLVRAEGAESLLARIKGAQPFSSYFFVHLSERLDLRTIEGRAALVKSAKPLIEKISLGVFRGMIEQRLAELTGHAPVETVDKSAKLFEKGSRSASRDRLKLSTLRMFLALLLQNPSLAATIDGETRRQLAKAEKGGELIKKILELLEERSDLTPGGILEFFRGAPEEAFITKLIGWDTLVVPDSVGTVFSDALMRLKNRIKSQRLDELIQKSTTGLSAEEREELRMLMAE